MARTSVGLELGTHSVKVVHLRVADQGLVIENAIYLDRKGLAARSVDIDDRAAVATLLRRMMNEKRIPTRGVILSISGSEAILRYTAVPPVPAWRLKVIMEFEVNSVAERMGEELTSDFRLLPIPRESEDDQVVLVGLAKEAQLGEVLTDLESAGIFVKRAVPAPLGLYTAYSTFAGEADDSDRDVDKDDVTVLVDIGRSTLNTVIVLNGNIIFARSASYGGESFTEAVARDLGVDARKAESLKIKKGSVGIDAPAGHEELVSALRGGAAQVQNVIQSALRFCRTQTGVRVPDPDRIVLVGGGSRLFGLDTYLGQAFKKPVQRLETPGMVPSENIDDQTAKALRSRPGDFAVAIGLAVTSLREKSFQLEIIPQKYKDKRQFRERTLFLYAAGALLLLTVMVGFWDGWSSLSREEGRYETLQSARTGLQAQKTEMDENYERTMQVEERINRLLREVEITSFQAALMDFFLKSLPAEVRLLRLRLGDNLDETDTDFEYRMVVMASADNSDQRGIDVIRDFERRLREIPDVASVVIERPESVGTDYEFRVVVNPAFQSYQGF
jgi:type IV pilus assembly protein PilM